MRNWRAKLKGRKNNRILFSVQTGQGDIEPCDDSVTAGKLVSFVLFWREREMREKERDERER